MIDKKRFCQTCAQAEIAIDGVTADKFLDYSIFLEEFNSHTNLTAITNDIDVENKHFIDSLIFSSQPEVEHSLLDIGSGAGFPGVPAKIMHPEMHVALLESNGKKANFLGQLAERLSIEYEVINMRAEDAAHMRQYRGKFHTVTARAVAQLNVLCEFCLPFLELNGYFIAMKGADAHDETQQALQAIEKLGGQLLPVREYSLPDGVRRSLIIIRKQNPTPESFPRNPAAVKKRPL